MTDRLPSDIRLDPADVDWQVRAGLVPAPPPKPSRPLSFMYDVPGNPADALRLVEVDVPPPGPGQIEVRFLKAPINPSDINMIEGKYPIAPQLPNGVPGLEGAGVVTAVGPGVSSLQVGDWVTPFIPLLGTWRQKGVFDATHFYRLPAAECISIDHAATLGVNPPTGLALLTKYVKLKPGDTVIQNGANSATGQIVIQLCKAMGVNSINIIRERADFDRVTAELKAMGATVVTTDVKLRSAMMAAKLPEPILGLNCIGGNAALSVAKVLKDGGTMVTYGGMSMQPVTLPTSLFIFRDMKFHGFWLTRGWQDPENQKWRKGLMDECVEYIRRGELKTACQTFHFTDYKRALEAANSPIKGPKVLLEL